MRFGIVHLAQAPMRAEASEKSEMISQLLFGECVHIISHDPKWLQVKNVYDGYQGWVSDKQVVEISPEEYERSSANATILCADIGGMIKVNNQNCPVTMGAVFPQYADEKFQLASKPGNAQLSVIDSANNPPTENNIISIAMKYINAPYLWGGRTPFGIDCSGFVQMVFRFMGIKLYRDAYQQAEQGRMVEFINQTQTGDLAFFDNDQKRIIHVGIILPDRKIIHASGQVRVDTLDHYGIFNADTNSYSHKLRVIRRLI